MGKDCSRIRHSTRPSPDDQSKSNPHVAGPPSPNTISAARSKPPSIRTSPTRRFFKCFRSFIANPDGCAPVSGLSVAVWIRAPDSIKRNSFEALSSSSSSSSKSESSLAVDFKRATSFALRPNFSRKVFGLAPSYALTSRDPTSWVFK